MQQTGCERLSRTSLIIPDHLQKHLKKSTNRLESARSMLLRKFLLPSLFGQLNTYIHSKASVTPSKIPFRSRMLTVTRQFAFSQTLRNIAGQGLSHKYSPRTLHFRLKNKDMNLFYSCLDPSEAPATTGLHRKKKHTPSSPLSNARIIYSCARPVSYYSRITRI